jgi:hypothetical protein
MGCSSLYGYDVVLTFKDQTGRKITEITIPYHQSTTVNFSLAG